MFKKRHKSKIKSQLLALKRNKNLKYKKLNKKVLIRAKSLKEMTLVLVEVVKSTKTAVEKVDLKRGF
jgi:hypothetical protein